MNFSFAFIRLFFRIFLIDRCLFKFFFSVLEIFRSSDLARRIKAVNIGRVASLYSTGDAYVSIHMYAQTRYILNASKQRRNEYSFQRRVALASHTHTRTRIIICIFKTHIILISPKTGHTGFSCRVVFFPGVVCTLLPARRGRNRDMG